MRQRMSERERERERQQTEGGNEELWQRGVEHGLKKNTGNLNKCGLEVEER